MWRSSLPIVGMSISSIGLVGAGCSRPKPSKSVNCSGNWVMFCSSSHTYIHMQIIYDDSQQAITWVVCVIRHVFIADSKTGRLHILLTVSFVTVLLVRMYLIQPSLMSMGLPKKQMSPLNSSCIKMSCEINSSQLKKCSSNTLDQTSKVHSRKDAELGVHQFQCATCTAILWPRGMLHILATAAIWRRHLFRSELLIVRLLFRSGIYSKKYSTCLVGFCLRRYSLIMLAMLPLDFLVPILGVIIVRILYG